jgi:hypothetical protein
MKTVEELYIDYKKVCEEYGVKAEEQIKDIIITKIEGINIRKHELYHLAKNSIEYSDNLYPIYKGTIKVNTILKKFDTVHIHMLVLWDNLQFIDFVIYPLKRD